MGSGLILTPPSHSDTRRNSSGMSFDRMMTSFLKPYTCLFAMLVFHSHSHISASRVTYTRPSLLP